MTVEQAHAARQPLRRSTPSERAGWLEAAADALDAAAGELVELAASETHLPLPRLTGELKRTTFQARLFAGALRSGELEAVRVDHADPSWGMGPRPDLRRTVVPIGPVLVFAASNFPFAFSVFGGDTVSALAAGCPVVVKAHPGHPELSRRVAAIVSDHVPYGGFSLIEGVDASLDAIRDPRIKAVGFTGSLKGGRALFDIAASRPDPIPFYGELGSVNPVVVTPAAWAERGETITAEWVGSLTLGAGQFCTNPGVVLVPDADAFLAHLDLPAPGRMLTGTIEQGYAAAVGAVGELAASAAEGPVNDQGVRAVVLRADAKDVLAEPRMLEIEMFGPAGLVVGYASADELLAVLDQIPGQLTGTVQGRRDGDDPIGAEVVELLADRAGRVLWNDWPTGVSVTGAQHHGGPYPATTSPLHTSVGLHAIDRFRRPVAFQGVPNSLLPSELKDPS